MPIQSGAKAPFAAIVYVPPVPGCCSHPMFSQFQDLQLALSSHVGKSGYSPPVPATSTHPVGVQSYDIQVSSQVVYDVGYSACVYVPPVPSCISQPVTLQLYDSQVPVHSASVV